MRPSTPARKPLPAFLPLPSLPSPYPRNRLSHAAISQHRPPIAITSAQPRKLSLPTFRERRHLSETRIERARGRPSYFSRGTAATLSVWPLVIRDATPDETRRNLAWRARVSELAFADASFETPSPPGDSRAAHEATLVLAPVERELAIPRWAYVVRVRVGKSVLGKRAVQRNRARRRIRAAAAALFPGHAVRGREYVFSVCPEALTISYGELLGEVTELLKKTGCWVDEMDEECLRRAWYCRRG